ncbi:DUF4005 domain-containing protein [Heracleum sosnowskyi]|uniref:DUF4005 domain-containing protein n=1 Tax=Heracleum sosnowskyi TaxID=360622 RepID=A0AAD8M5V0_9APIA|nr:DUF4005 domain-containing protein [Heracleum sosnowskyi]
MTSDGSMARKSCFSLVKKFFISDTDINQHKKQRRRRWLFGIFKIKLVPSIPASSPTRYTQEKSDQNSNVDILMAAAAADEIVADIYYQPSASTSLHTCQREDQCREFSSINFKYNSPTSALHRRREIKELAATKIQIAFRGYLALKGIVRLQATIRGILVRRQAITTLERLQSIVNIQSQVRAKRRHMLDGSSRSLGNKEVMDFKVDLNNRRRWDDSLLTKQEEKRSAELEQNKIDGRWRFWLEKWVDTRIPKREDLHNLVSVVSNRERIEDDKLGVKLVKPRNLHKQCHYEESGLPATRSFHRGKQQSIGKIYSAGGGSPVVPTYMAATESAKAKVRSMSTPRLRPMCFDSNPKTISPYNHKLSPISSIKSEVTTTSMLTRFSNGYSRRSPRLKEPIKSNRNSK